MTFIQFLSLGTASWALYFNVSWSKAIFFPLVIVALIVLVTGHDWRAKRKIHLLWMLILLSQVLILAQNKHYEISIVIAVLALINIVKPIRQYCLTAPLMWILKKLSIFPKISDTEKTALDAGETWIEKEFFSGLPNIETLKNQPFPKLTEEEQGFLDNETETLCSMIDDWSIYKSRRIPLDIDDYIRKNKFLGINIPKKFDGLGFSHLAHSKILEKICSKSYAVGIYVMVPNSLGPGELLVHYGTASQKERYLSKLANGEEIPCFGLTEPRAGSDASSIESKGRVFKDANGDLKISLTWNKRWITLSSVATLLGLAFKLEDPEELLGKGKDLGITCALVPAHLPGIKIDTRHDPMGIPFPNSPMEGKDVVISTDDIIGGVEMTGQGWKMLMDCLGTGRGISLPSSSLASSKMVTLVSTYYSTVRQQFGISIGKFEGIREKLASISGRSLLSQSMLTYTLSALNRNISSAICSAMAKYQMTEWGRSIVTDGMDIMAGAGISMGPKNFFALSYMGAPISITVEGANILTRSFIIFGQGLIRSHPYAYKEIKALEEWDIRAFDEAFWGHVGHVCTNTIRFILLFITRGIFIFVPHNRYKGLRAWQKISWASCTFAFLSDVAMIVLGGQLKVKESITGRFADVMINLYTATATLWFWENKNYDSNLWPHVKWALDYSFHNIQKAFEDIIYNMKIPFFSWAFRPLFLLIYLNPISFNKPSDKVEEQAVRQLAHTETLDTLTKGVFIPKDKDSQLQKLKSCYDLSRESLPIVSKMKSAMRQNKLAKSRIFSTIDLAVKKEVISFEEGEFMHNLENLRWDVIQVDAFDDTEYFNS